MNRDQPLDNNFVSNEADIREMDVLNGRGKVDHRKLYSFRSCLMDGEHKTLADRIVRILFAPLSNSGQRILPPSHPGALYTI